MNPVACSLLLFAILAHQGLEQALKTVAPKFRLSFILAGPILGRT